MLFLFISLICVWAVIYSGMTAVSIALSGTALEPPPPAAEQEEVPTEPVTEPEVEAPTEPEASEPESSSVAVSENNTVSGKILTKTILPSSAKLSYNGIYLKNSTDAPINLREEFEAPFSLALDETAEPQVLIYHTHATESFMLENRDYYTEGDAARSTDTSINMVAVGDKLRTQLEAAGIGVLHDKTLHDYPSYNGSYTASAKTIKSYLQKYPSIKIIIDVHRDALGGGGNDKTKLVAEINGKTAAQVMLVMGSQTGVVTTYPDWKENLHLAMRLQQTMESMYPSLARPILLASKKYNQNLSKGAMLLEVGTDANTLEEALYSAELVGNALAALLK